MLFFVFSEDMSLKVFISSSVYVTIDPGASSVVASPSCLVELLHCVHRVFFLVVASERGFLCPSKNLQFSSVQSNEEPLAHFEKHVCLFLALGKVTMVFKTF